MSADRPAWACSTCDETGTARYCCPSRCYCGHPTCHAYASFVEAQENRERTNATATKTTTTTKPGRSAWDDREGSTWIDQL